MKTFNDRALGVQIAAILLCTLVALPAWGRWGGKKREPRPEICALKTVYVSGSSQMADKVRKHLEKSTWLKLENDKSKADGILEVSETHTATRHQLGEPDFTASGELRQGSKLLWSDSVTTVGSWFLFGPDSVAMELLRHLSRDAACK